MLGAGGDRDPGKRPLMGEIAARAADVLVVTDDNPRSEDPAAHPRGRSWTAPAGGTRRGRSRSATAGPPSPRPYAARGPGDVVLIAGKGHETGQEVAGVLHPFDDRVVAREELRR